ncbi:Ribulose-phosphate 3-epimerase [hydrothermal vent metagenome]|uniref:Ribulose-phosphate 3-epimerase n=1 Tax=hydrothermal vent metagenome TaxID=652676 RepID=A0A3B1C559_9ZZZZ
MPSLKTFDILREQSPTISPGVISADLMSLNTELLKLEEAGLRMVHFDVMDGHFVPSLTVGPPFVKAVKTTLLKDVHLMINGADKMASDFISAGADIITVHIEACDDALGLLENIGGMENVNDPQRGIVRGIAINPSTPVEAVEALLGQVELIVLLAVDPSGVASPSFDLTVERFEKLKQIVSASGLDILLCVDGGVKKNNIGEYAKMGADIYVSGSALFSGAIDENVRFMLDALRLCKRGIN